VSFRASRSERDARAYESRLKHYENEIAELKARSDAITFDATRRMEENEVRLFSRASISIHALVFVRHCNYSRVIWKNKFTH
jgi:hypothetical protein